MYKKCIRCYEDNKKPNNEDCNKCNEELKRLEQENAELKERLKTLDDEEFVYEVSEIEYNNFKKMNDYKQALEEIREMCKKVAFSNGCNNCDGIGFYDGCLDDDCGNYACFKVLDKINEVLNVE